MAKWGEGDPRWIVEERADATNVNNWHWTEKNATPWSKDKLRSLLEGLVIENDKYRCEVKELTKIEGEASANNRKAKLFFFYEWELKASWKGWAKFGDDEDKKISGTLEIPNLSEEHTPEEVDINVEVTGDTSNTAFDVKNFFRADGAQKIRELLGKYIVDLKSEFSQGMILPAKDDVSELKALDLNCTEANQASGASKKGESVQPSKDVKWSLGVKIPCKSLTLTEEFKCSTGDLYRALTDKEMIRAFTQSLAQVDAQKGGRFSLFNGNVVGEFTDLVTDKKIEMRWRFKTWPDEHYSNVTIELTQKADGVDLRLSQSGIPTNDFDRTKEGWQNYYWRSMKQTFGYGAYIY